MATAGAVLSAAGTAAGWKGCKEGSKLAFISSGFGSVAFAAGVIETNVETGGAAGALAKGFEINLSGAAAATEIAVITAKLTGKPSSKTGSRKKARGSKR